MVGENRDEGRMKKIEISRERRQGEGKKGQGEKGSKEKGQTK